MLEGTLNVVSTEPKAVLGLLTLALLDQTRQQLVLWMDLGVRVWVGGQCEKAGSRGAV